MPFTVYYSTKATPGKILKAAVADATTIAAGLPVQAIALVLSDTRLDNFTKGNPQPAIDLLLAAAQRQNDTSLTGTQVRVIKFADGADPIGKNVQSSLPADTATFSTVMGTSHIGILCRATDCISDLNYINNAWKKAALKAKNDRYRLADSNPPP